MGGWRYYSDILRNPFGKPQYEYDQADFRNLRLKRVTGSCAGSKIYTMNSLTKAGCDTSQQLIVGLPLTPTADLCDRILIARLSLDPGMLT